MLDRQHAAEKMLTLQEVAQLLNVHPNTVRRLVVAGSISAYRISMRGDLRFRFDDVWKYLDRNRVNVEH